MKLLKAQEIIKANGFLAENGNWQKLNSSIDFEEAQFISDLIKKYDPQKTLEIGCATGISSLTICESLSPKAYHTIVDPNQSYQWQNMGANNLKKFGFNNYQIIEDYSEFVLPELLKKEEKFDFIFIDGWHTFDHVLLEFFYINRLLNIGGIVAFDDIALPGINRVLRYISNYPSFKNVGYVGHIEVTWLRSMISLVSQIVYLLSLPFGKKIQQELLNDKVCRSDTKLKIKGSVAAFQKIEEDNREWGWYKSF